MEEKSHKHVLNVDFFEGLTGDIKAEPAKGLEDIGQRIRKIREEKGLINESFREDIRLLYGVKKSVLEKRSFMWCASVYPKINLFDRMFVNVTA